MKKVIIFLFCFFYSVQLFAQCSYFITSSDHIKINVNEYGKGKPIVLLAGGPGLNAGYLGAIWNKFPDYRFIVPDQRATGKSLLPSIDSTSASVDRYVEDLEALRVHLGLEHMVIAGHSWGGMLAMAYAAKYPARVSRLLLIASGGVTNNFVNYFGDNIDARLLDEDIAESNIQDHNGLHNLKGKWPGYFYSRKRAIATKVYLTNESMGQDSRKVLNITLTDYDKTSAYRIVALRKYYGPVCIIQGYQDPMGEATAYETKSILPQTEINFIMKCGHLPWLEEQATAQEFFKQLKLKLP